MYLLFFADADASIGTAKRHIFLRFEIDFSDVYLTKVACLTLPKCIYLYEVDKNCARTVMKCRTLVK